MQQLTRLSANRGGTTVLGFDPSGSHLYSGGFDEILRRWDIATIARVAYGPTRDVLEATAINATLIFQPKAPKDTK